jgi:hypothetical protein
MNNYYVYFHFCGKTQNIFYVGKGKGDRAFNSVNRTTRWHNYVKANGYTVKIMYENLTENEALSLENKLIAEHKDNGFLVNIAQVETFPRIPKPTDGLTKKQILKKNIERIKEERAKLDAEKLKEEKALLDAEKLKVQQNKNLKTALNENSLICWTCGISAKVTYSATYPHDTWLCEECYKEKYNIDPVTNQPLNKLQPKQIPLPSTQPSRQIESSRFNERQLNYLHSQGRLNSHYYYKEKNKYR